MSKYLENVGEYVAKDVTVAFTDEDGAAAIPTNVMWRLTCPDDNDSVVTDWATATAATSVICEAPIAIVASSHAMVTTTLAKEKRALIVAANKDLDTEWNEEFIYYVERRSGRS